MERRDGKGRDEIWREETGREEMRYGEKRRE
jgi:hypothetical protein